MYCKWKQQVPVRASGINSNELINNANLISHVKWGWLCSELRIFSCLLCFTHYFEFGLPLICQATYSSGNSAICNIIGNCDIRCIYTLFGLPACRISTVRYADRSQYIIFLGFKTSRDPNEKKNLEKPQCLILSFRKTQSTLHE